MKVAISVRGATIGHDFDEGDILYVNVPEEHVRKLHSKFLKELSSDDVQTLKELSEIMRKTHILWGI